MKLPIKTTIIILLLSLVTFSAGWVLGSISEKNKKEAPTSNEIWTCSMHPEVQMPKAGKCPKCGMALIVQSNSSKGNDAIYEMSPLAEKLAEIEVVEAQKKILTYELPLVGKAYYDERTTNTISAWFPGRIDRLFVDFTGTRVRKGEHLAMQYSPELLAAQEELIEAAKRVQAKDQSPFLKKSNFQLLKSSKEKLRLWGLNEKQINKIIDDKKGEDHMEIQSSQNGVVVKKFVTEGDYVKTGSKLFTIASLEHLWVFLDVYESELSFIYYGQKVSLESEAYPGQFFHGTVSFIQPELDEKTRTVRIRVNVDNKDLKLKPGMLMNAKVSVKVGHHGTISYPDFSGKWICPMHPEVIENNSGKCRICQMDLVKTESMNMKKPKPLKPALVIPETAVLITGKRAVVYVQHGNKYEGREIVLGPKVGREYIVIDGLEEGELVVARGNFKIDSALQIIAKPSMMKNKWPEDGSQYLAEFKKASAPKENIIVLKKVFDLYLLANQLLAKDDFGSAKKVIAQWGKPITKALAEATLAAQTKKELKNIKNNFLIHLKHFSDIKGLRKAWQTVSEAMVKIQSKSGNPTSHTVYTAYCPMVKTNWLQLNKSVKNPFYGSSMLDCGSIKGSKKSSVKTTPRVDNSMLKTLFTHYLAVNKALAGDQIEPAKNSMKKMISDIKELSDGTSLSQRSIREIKVIANILKHTDHYKDLKALREAWSKASLAMINLEKINANPLSKKLFTVYCSMAEASWLQLGEDIRNPYYGKSMLDCGEIKSSSKPSERGE